MALDYYQWRDREIRLNTPGACRQKTDRTDSWNVYSCLLVRTVILESQGCRVHPRRIHQSFIRHARAMGKGCRS